MISPEDSVANKIYWLCIAEVLAGDMFMSQPVSEMFSSAGIGTYIICLVDLGNLALVVCSKNLQRLYCGKMLFSTI